MIVRQVIATSLSSMIDVRYVNILAFKFVNQLTAFPQVIITLICYTLVRVRL